MAQKLKGLAEEFKESDKDEYFEGVEPGNVKGKLHDFAHNWSEKKKQNTITTSAASLPTSTSARLACWMSEVFQVPQPYSLPDASAPKISASAPTNTAYPASELPTRW